MTLRRKHWDNKQTKKPPQSSPAFHWQICLSALKNLLKFWQGSHCEIRNLSFVVSKGEKKYIKKGSSTIQWSLSMQHEKSPWRFTEIQPPLRTGRTVRAVHLAMTFHALLPSCQQFEGCRRESLLLCCSFGPPHPRHVLLTRKVSVYTMALSTEFGLKCGPVHTPSFAVREGLKQRKPGTCGHGDPHLFWYRSWKMPTE